MNEEIKVGECYIYHSGVIDYALVPYAVSNNNVSADYVSRRAGTVAWDRYSSSVKDGNHLISVSGMLLKSYHASDQLREYVIMCNKKGELIPMTNKEISLLHVKHQLTNTFKIF